MYVITMLISTCIFSAWLFRVDSGVSFGPAVVRLLQSHLAMSRWLRRRRCGPNEKLDPIPETLLRLENSQLFTRFMQDEP